MSDSTAARHTPGPERATASGPGTLESTVIHDGRIVELSVDRVRFPNGSEGDLEMVRHRGAAAVLGFFGPRSDPDPEIVLLRQYRYATGGEIYEVPAGMPEGSESWEACARRELEEETGWVAGPVRSMTRIFTTPGFTNEVIHLFAAWGLERGRVDRDDDEFVEVLRTPFSTAVKWVEDGRIVDGKSVAAILYGERFVVGG